MLQIFNSGQHISISLIIKALQHTLQYYHFILRTQHRVYNYIQEMLYCSITVWLALAQWVTSSRYDFDKIDDESTKL